MYLLAPAQRSKLVLHILMKSTEAVIKFTLSIN